MMWLAILDMDGTLLRRRTVDVLCEKLGLNERLQEIDRESKLLEDWEVSAKIAELFSGIKASKMERIFDAMQLVEGAEEFVNFLKSKGFATAIVTDSYLFLASRLARKLGMDAVRGNELEIVRGTVTGRIIRPLCLREGRRKKHLETARCKLRIMNNLVKEFSVRENRTLVVGDTKSDLSIVQKARIGVAFRPKDGSIQKVADIIIRTDFYDLIDALKTFLESGAISEAGSNAFRKKRSTRSG
jgi:phosphoserine phosphatase